MTELERIAAEIAKFHCTPGTFDACQIDQDDPIFLMLCKTCGELADEIALALRAAFARGEAAALLRLPPVEAPRAQTPETP